MLRYFITLGEQNGKFCGRSVYTNKFPDAFCRSIGNVDGSRFCDA